MRKKKPRLPPLPMLRERYGDTHFEIFVRAVEACGDRDDILGLNPLVFPPSPDYGYASTPRNSVTFAHMGVDGVHYAVLKIDGVVTDSSPVIHIGPMDFSEPYLVLAESFVAYLAQGCAVSTDEMARVVEDERAGGKTLIAFLKQHFVDERLFDEELPTRLKEYLALIELKPEALE